MQLTELSRFLNESNGIENITRVCTNAELKEAKRFLALDEVTIEDLERFVAVYQPGARLRIKDGDDVIVGRYTPRPGGPGVVYALKGILDTANLHKPQNALLIFNSFKTHVRYERLHPFTDGNGRSGRMLWLWQEYKRLGKLPTLGFLHSFYYQTLANS